MQAHVEHANVETQLLRRCISDLICLVAMPSLWCGAAPRQVARTLVDALVSMLQLDLAYIWLAPCDDWSADEVAQSGSKDGLEQAGALLRRALGEDPLGWPSRAQPRLNGAEVSLVCMRLGMQAELGVLVAASTRASFAQVTEELLLNVAVNQAVMALQSAQRLGAQQRLAQTLDQRVAERTRELAHTNLVLQHEIAERRRVEDALRASEAFLIEGQRLSSTGSFSWQLNDDRIKFSDELYRIFAFELATPVTLNRIRERVHPEDQAILAQLLGLARSSLGEHARDIRLCLPDGAVRHLRSVARAIPHSDGRLEFLGTIQDVTHSRLAEAALARVRSELAHVTRTMSLGVLTASIAHEVNQPLAGIITNASTCLRMLSATPPNIEGALLTARRTIRDGNRAADVISRLRALFRKKDVSRETFDLNQATREVIALCSQDLQRRRIALHAELADEPCAIRGDRVQLQQVILNLLSNASDALQAIDDRPRQISIRTERQPDGAARLSVRDTGCGLSLELRSKLFDAFFTTKLEGMGIGLSVSRSIIEGHRGRLWCEPNDGPGATFSFIIPAD